MFLVECPGSGRTNPPALGDVTLKSHVALKVTTWNPIGETDAPNAGSVPHLKRKYKSSTPGQKLTLTYTYIQQFSLKFRKLN